MSYQFDVFLSYCRRPPVGDWVANHFEPQLREWLAECSPTEPVVFFDRDIETGVEWPLKLRNALKTTRVLVPVFSPSYFRSTWCRAELHSMMARERVLGMRTEDNPGGLVYPVRFNDGEYFDEDVRGMQMRDFGRWNVPQRSYAGTPEYVDFVREIQAVAQELAQLLLQTPPWSEGWPVETPPPLAPAAVPLPRL